jgi:hypothetical protein
MGLRTRWILPVALLAALLAPRPVVWARSPVLPIPAPRQDSSILAPKSGVPKTPLKGANGKAGTKKKSWFPFGNRNKKVRLR